MIHITDKTECCGCSACVQICGHNAINMKTDNLGFSYPLVNQEKCIDCGLCEKVCPILNENLERVPTRVFAVKNKDIDVRLQSSSGGVFSILAEKTILNGGIVYGAIFDKDWNVVHSKIDRIETIYKLRGSKYVQSNLGETFKEIKSELKRGAEVLFSGTPCQVAGLLRFLRKKYTNLTTVDFVCHGVPNPKIWKDYLSERLASELKIANVPFCKTHLPMSYIEDIRFRDKTNGWLKFNFVLSITKASDEDNQNSVLSYLNEYSWDNEYMTLFLKDYILRPSCHKCHFRNGKSGSDYTIADYWGIEKFYPDFFDDNGVSLFLSYDGTIPVYLTERSDYIETKFEEACYGNYALKSSWPYNPASSLFYFFHNELGLNIHNSLKYLKIYEKRINNLKQVKLNIIKTLRRIKHIIT